MGMEFRDATYVLSPKNARQLKTNMIFNLGLGFSDLTDTNGQKYALHIVDTVRVDANKSVLLTDGVKQSKETLFFLDAGSEVEVTKKPAAKSRANGSPAKAKTIGGKVLRNPRRAVQDEVHQTAAARLMEHQRELHERLQEEGLAKWSEGGSSTSGKEGKGWKKYQSYKGEGGLPDEVERLRVCPGSPCKAKTDTNMLFRFLLIAKLNLSFFLFMGLLSLSTLTQLRMPVRATKVTSRISESTSKRPAN